MASSSNSQLDLRNAFRHHYYSFIAKIQEIILTFSDSVVIERLGDDLDEYTRLFEEHVNVFDDEAEIAMIRTNLAGMQNDIRQHYNDILDQSHQGRPVVIRTEHTGLRGRPSIHIDEDFLRWAYTMRSTSSISRYLGVSRATVRNTLLEYGIVEPQERPFRDLVTDDPDDLLDPVGNHELAGNEGPHASRSHISQLSDEDLDFLIRDLRQNFHRAGITMLTGMLRNIGHRVPRERVRAALIRIDPVQRVFQRIRIRRRVYSVPGPNSLWHHDGQHGLIRWGIIIHGFIDGYSRLITALRASNNNRAETVLWLFLNAVLVYGVPSRVRGDHGVENVQVAAWIEAFRGERRGSYIWGRSIHNVRIERLWVDVTAQVGASWADYFTELEIQHGLDINNTSHICLLHILFLPLINSQLAFFAESWNVHTIQIRGGPNRSPADMFGFDMLVHGVRGDRLPEPEIVGEDELEVYGVDWEALQDDQVLNAHHGNNNSGLGEEGHSSWIGRTGPPEQLNEVPVEPPNALFTAEQTELITSHVQEWLQRSDLQSVVNVWSRALAVARTMYPHLI